jgi:hypothetical protein
MTVAYRTSRLETCILKVYNRKQTQHTDRDSYPVNVKCVSVGQLVTGPSSKRGALFSTKGEKFIPRFVNTKLWPADKCKTIAELRFQDFNSS